jgi:hypothetical protein
MQIGYAMRFCFPYAVMLQYKVQFPCCSAGNGQYPSENLGVMWTLNCILLAGNCFGNPSIAGWTL